MRPAAPRFLVRSTITLLIAASAAAAETPPRVAPTRPSSATIAPEQTRAATTKKAAAAMSVATPKPATRKPAADQRAAKVETIGIDDAAARLGLKVSSAGGRMFVLSDKARRLELGVGSREAKIDGVRLFLGEPTVLRKGRLHISKTDFDACLVPLLKPSLLQRVPRMPKTIALDPGHGGVDQGTQNPRLGLKEKVFTLDVALRLKKLLEARGYRVVLTREKDERVELQSRAIIANRAAADLFVSLHFNSLFPDTKTAGAEVFTFTRAGQKSDQARAFGAADDTETEPAPVNRHDPWSVLLADALHRSTLEALKLPDRGHKTKHLGMLRGLNCPGVLVESGFLSNDEEAQKISTPFYRQQIAEALAAGIENYAKVIRSLNAKR